MADRDVVLADQDLADDESRDLLALLDGQALGVVGEPGAEAVECLGELEVGLGVVQLGVERVELRLDRGLAFAQLGRAGAELVDRDELLLVAVQQSSDRVLGADEVALERVSSAGGGVRVWPLCLRLTGVRVTRRGDRRLQDPGTQQYAALFGYLDELPSWTWDVPQGHAMTVHVFRTSRRARKRSLARAVTQRRAAL